MLVRVHHAGYRIPPQITRGQFEGHAGVRDVGHGDDLIDDPRQLEPGLAAVDLRLRDPVAGCPWDQAQDFGSIAPYTVEAPERASAEAAERWLASDGGPDNEMTRQAPDVCESCGFFARIEGSLGVLFGVCANAYSPSDARVVSVDHGCGAHSAVVAENRAEELPAPAWETIDWDEPISLFD